MPSTAEVMTLLAVVEAQDQATNVLKSVADVFRNLGSTINAASDSSTAAMDRLNAAYARGEIDAVKMSAVEENLTRAQENAALTTSALADAQARLNAALMAGDASQLEAAMVGVRNAETAAAVSARELEGAQRNLADANLVVANAGTVVKDGIMAAGKAATLASAGILVAAGASVKLAGDFQASTTTLVTGAGVSADRIDEVRKYLLDLSVQAGVSTKELSDGFFQVNSRTGDVTKSMEIMTSASEMAQVHHADLATTVKSVADAMNSYGEKAGSAAQVSNILGQAVEVGGMSMQDLGNSLSSVLPFASSAGVSLSEVAAALGVMTKQGMSAQQASQELAHTIQKLQAPTDTMRNAWNQAGITAQQMTDTLHGPGGLAAALDLATQAALKIAPGGEDAAKAFKQSADAGSALNSMLQSMSPNLQALSQKFLDGNLGAKEYTKAVKEMGAQGAGQGAQFLSLAEKANGFNDALKSGKPGFADFDAALKATTGDQNTMQAALMLTGSHLADFKSKTDEISGAAGTANGKIQGWNQTQETLNFKMKQAKEAFAAAGIVLGTTLLPIVTKIVQAILPWVEKLATLIQHHQTLVKLLVGAAAAVVTMVAGFKALMVVAETVKALSAAFGVLSAAMGLFTTAEEAGTAGMVAFDAAADANPLGAIVLAIELVIAALVALGVGVVYAYNHFKWFHDFVNTVWNGLKEGAMATWHGLEAAFHAIAAAAVWVYDNGILPMWHGIETAYEAVKSATLAVWHALETAWNAVVSAVMGAAQAIWSGIVSVFDAIKGFFEKWWPLLLVIFAFPIAVLVSIWNHFHETITSVAKTVWNAIKDFFVMIWDGLKEGAQAAWNLIKEYIVNPIKSAWNVLVSIGNAIGSTLSSAWNYVASAASSAWNSVKGYIINPFREAYNELASLMGSIGNAISGGFNSILSFLSGIGSWFMSVGSNIVHGIISGVENAGGALLSKLKDLAHSALDAAKSFLGISSPSRLFASEVGKWIPHGVAQGVVAHTSEAVNAVADMAGKLPQAIGVKGAVNIGVNGLNAAGTVMATGLGLTSGGMTAGAAGGGDVHVHVDLGNAVIAGQQGMQDLVRRIGEQVAVKTLPQAGVRIHY